VLVSGIRGNLLVKQSTKTANSWRGNAGRTICHILCLHLVCPKMHCIMSYLGNAFNPGNNLIRWWQPFKRKNGLSGSQLHETEMWCLSVEGRGVCRLLLETFTWKYHHPHFPATQGLVVKFCPQGSSEENYLAASRSEILLVVLNRTISRKIPLTKGLCLNLSSCHFLVVSLVQTKYFTRLISWQK